MQHPRLSEVLDAYVTLRKARLAPTTARNEEFVLRRFVASIGDIQVRHLTPQHVERWFYGPNGVMADHRSRDGRDRKPIQNSTHNFYRTRLKEFFNDLTRRGLTKSDLLQEVHPQRVDIKKRLQPGAEMLWAMLDKTSAHATAPSWRPS